MWYGLMITCALTWCDASNALYTKEYGPFKSGTECTSNANKALNEVPPNVRKNPRYTCQNRK